MNQTDPALTKITMHSKRYALLSTLILSIVFLFSFYGKLITSPNSYLFTEHGDGIKNYFTYAGQAKSSSLVHSNLMNYPYGENFLYLDCHPAFTLALQRLSTPFPGIESYSVGIINSLMLFSFVLTSLFVFLILIELKVKPLLSVLGSLAVAIMAPQVHRLTGHLALSYSFFIPLTWYLFMKFHTSSRQIKWSVAIFINNLLWYFIHAYLGMILVAFLFLCFMADFIFENRKRLTKPAIWAHIFTQTFLPLLVFWAFASATDIHTGRTNNPYGFLVYTSTFDSVFFPNQGWLKSLWEQIITIDQKWEGLAYIGLLPSVSVLLFILNRLLKLIKRRTFVDDRPIIQNPIISTALFSAFVLLLLSMGYPFKLKMEFLLEWFPVIKNFRGVGRFSWVFYYIATISAIFFANSLLQNHKRKPIKVIISILLPLSLACEGLPYHWSKQDELTKTPNLFDRRQLPAAMQKALQQIDSSNFQAILPLPYYHIGSENFGKDGSDKIYKLSMVLGYHSGLPILSNYSTRTSICETKKLIEVLSPDFYPKEIEKDMPSEKPFLVLYSKEDLTPEESSILSKCRKHYADDNLYIGEISFPALFADRSAEAITQFESLKDSLLFTSGFYINHQDSGKYIFYEPFEDQPQQFSYRGKGALSGAKKAYTRLKTFETDELETGKEYIVSFWMYNDGDNFGQDVLNSIVFIEKKYKDGHGDWVSVHNPAKSMIINGAWSMVELSFMKDGDEKELSVMLKGDERSELDFYIDDLLIRERAMDVYMAQMNDGSIEELFLNNHKIIQKE